MTTVWFTSDLHLGWPKILELQPNRAEYLGTHDIEAHDMVIVGAINNLVGRKDILWHLGDFSRHGLVARYRGEIECKNIRVISGNHDKTTELEKVFGIDNVSPLKEIKICKQRITLCHYPMARWPASHYGSWQLFGHCHGRFVPSEYSFQLDVGVDVHALTPICFDQIHQIMKFRRAMIEMMLGGKRPTDRYVTEPPHGVYSCNQNPIATG